MILSKGEQFTVGNSSVRFTFLELSVKRQTEGAKQEQLTDRFSNTRGCCRVRSRKDPNPVSFVVAHAWNRMRP